VQMVLFSHPLFKGNTDGTVLTLGADALRSVTVPCFGVFLPGVVPSFTEGIWF